jgi:hypothetical protein
MTPEAGPILTPELLFEQIGRYSLEDVYAKYLSFNCLVFLEEDI